MLLAFTAGFSKGKIVHLTARVAVGKKLAKTERFHEEAEVQPRKILVVDDSKLIHKMFEVLLRQFSLIHAHDGLEALQCLGTHSEIDLVLLDINMPKMSGLEFLNQIKSDNMFKEIPVVIISTEGKEEYTIRGLEAGAAAYIKKPFGNQELLEVIQRL
jgi:two-component system chemotaxis response regulator CheY